MINAIAGYRRFIKDVREATSPLADCNPNDRRILGSDDFAAKLLGIAWRPKSRKSLEQLISEAEHTFLITPEALRSSSKQRKLTQARAWIAHQAVTLRVASLSHVARLLQRSESSLREAVQRYYPS